MNSSSARLLAILFSFLLSFANFAQDQNLSVRRSTRFHSGKILSAELMAKSLDVPPIINVNQYERTNRITSDVGFASLVVKPDKGRSISIYDYSLVNQRKDIFKCIAIKEGDGVFDAEKWCFKETDPNKLYTLLFKVQLPALNDPVEYVLRFNLGKETEDIRLPFVKIERAFTPSSKIPPEGILGIDIEAKEIKPEPSPKEEGVPPTPSL